MRCPASVSSASLRQVAAHAGERGLHFARDQARRVEPVARGRRRRGLLPGLAWACALGVVGRAVAVGVLRRRSSPNAASALAGVLELLAVGVERRAAAVLVAGVAGRRVAELLLVQAGEARARRGAGSASKERHAREGGNPVHSCLDAASDTGPLDSLRSEVEQGRHYFTHFLQQLRVPRQRGLAARRAGANRPAASACPPCRCRGSAPSRARRGSRPWP